jgi:DNA-nicking Smr family endonuclease
MRDVRRLNPVAAPPVPVVQPIPEPPAEPVAPVIANPPAQRRSDPAPGPVDGMTLERLRGGRARVDGRIDLHGMDQRQAHAALLGFVDSSARAGRRTLLVITGKGAISQGGGVLRRNVPHWLMASPFSRRILTIAPAHTRHGGDGALYVMLRKPR